VGKIWQLIGAPWQRGGVPSHGTTDTMVNPALAAPLDVGSGCASGRHPIPDYYSLTLEVSRNRTTAAWMDVCTAATRHRGRCRHGPNADQQLLHRTLNDVCLRVVRTNTCLRHWPLHILLALLLLKYILIKDNSFLQNCLRRVQGIF